MYDCGVVWEQQWKSSKKKKGVCLDVSRAGALSIENMCKMAIKHWFLNMSGSSLHSGEKFK
jgi:hypothetical protein